MGRVDTKYLINEVELIIRNEWYINWTKFEIVILEKNTNIQLEISW